MKRIVIAVLMILMICSAAIAEEKISIVATDFPCYDFARQVAGEWAEVSLLIKPGVEVHAYEPAPSDILSIGKADLFVYIGGESDAWVKNILDGFDGDAAPAQLAMMGAVECIEGEHHDHDGHEHHTGPVYDEHIWTSPKNAVMMIEALADKLCEVDSDHAEAYRANSAEYINEVQAIDAAFEAAVENGKRKELIFADRFPFLYFAEAYGLDYTAAFESCTAETEPSPQTIMTLIKRVASEKIPVIYTIEMSTQTVAKTIAEDTGAEILMLHSVQTVTQDEFDAGETYASLMWKNVEAIRKGLN